MNFKLHHKTILAFLFLFVINISTGQTNQALDYKQEMLILVNNLRVSNGIDPLFLSESLNSASFKHSKDMAENNYFSHTGQNGSRFNERIINAGYEGTPVGENIAAGNSSAENTFNQWVNSPDHLKNMLNRNANEMGIGTEFQNNSEYRHYWTQVFGRGALLSTPDYFLTNNKIKTHPSPATRLVHITTSSSTYLKTVKLINLNGHVVYETRENGLKKEISIAIDFLPSGIYILQINDKWSKKIVKL